MIHYECEKVIGEPNEILLRPLIMDFKVGKQTPQLFGCSINHAKPFQDLLEKCLGRKPPLLVAISCLPVVER